MDMTQPQEVDKGVSTQRIIRDLLFFDRGAMSFLDKEIPYGVIEEILSGATSCSWLGQWKLVSVTKKENRVGFVEVWQRALREIGQHRGAEFIERWKMAPLFVVFCQPKAFEPHQWVAPEFVRTFSIHEVGCAVRSLELVALTHGVGLHGIMGVLVPSVGGPIQEVLRVPQDYEIVYLGIMGYPDEQVVAKFPSLSEVCFSDSWDAR